MREDSLAPTPEIAAAPPVHLAKMPASRMETKLEQTVEKALMPVKTVIPAAARGSRLWPARGQVPRRRGIHKPQDLPDSGAV